MIPYAHQPVKAEEALAVLRKYGLVYLAMEERTGKTLVAIILAEMSKATRVLVVTKKKALDGWISTLAAYEHDKVYVVTNYHQVHKMVGKFDLVLLDESHNYISSFPKVGGMWNKVAKYTKDVPIVYISATPHAQGRQMLYHQFKLSSWTPWAGYANFYKWFNVYGFKYTIEVEGRPKNQYDKANQERLAAETKHLFVTGTRKELGFEQEPEDILHYVVLGKYITDIYNDLVKKRIVRLPEVTIVADTQSKMRFSLHQLEGGTIKMDDEAYVLKNNEKIDFILEHFGDSEQVVIMYNYKAEYTKLSSIFSNALLLQATSNAEGVDLSAYKHLVIYSQDFSTARHTQRRARQANKLRTEPIKVHYILTKGGVSSKVYKTVSKNKRNYVDTVFEGL